MIYLCILNDWLKFQFNLICIENIRNYKVNAYKFLQSGIEIEMILYFIFSVLFACAALIGKCIYLLND